MDLFFIDEAFDALVNLLFIRPKVERDVMLHADADWLLLLCGVVCTTRLSIGLHGLLSLELWNMFDLLRKGCG